MALAGRSARRTAAGARWIAIGIVITLLVLLIDASLHSRSPGPQQQLAAGTWVDRVLPIIATSSEDGRLLAGLWNNGLKMSASGISGSVATIASGSASAYNQVVNLRPPVDLDGPAGLLEAALLERSRAASALQTAFTGALGAAAAPATRAGAAGAAAGATGSAAGAAGATTTAAGIAGSVISAVQQAGSDIQAGDQVYQLFASSVPASLGVAMPASVWLTNNAAYQPSAAQVFFDSLHNSINPAPVHQLKIYSVTTSPTPEASQGSTEILPDQDYMAVTIVLADVGNQPENDLTVTASISPVGHGPSSVRDFVDLLPGEAHSIVGLGPLVPLQGPTETLTVSVTPPSGSPTPAVTQNVVFAMPTPPPTTTTTTPAGGSGGT